MAITSSAPTCKVDIVEQANIGGTAVTKIIAHQTATGTTTGISIEDENGKVEFTMFGGTAPAVGDTVTFTIA